MIIDFMQPVRAVCLDVSRNQDGGSLVPRVLRLLGQRVVAGLSR